MATTTSSSSREARRRRIAERGTDRLALITGRINNLPPSSEQPSPVVPHNEDKHFTSLSARRESSSDALQPDNNGGGTSVEPYRSQSEMKSEDSRPSTLDIDGRVTLRSENSRPAIHDIDGIVPVSSIIRTPSVSSSNIEHNSEPPTHRRCKIFSPNQISSAVSASDITRIYCSLAVAILVSISYLRSPFLASYIIKSVIQSRPLYLLLVTNISIVFAHLLLKKQRRVISSGEAAGGSFSGELGMAGQFGKALEAGLMLQHVVVALFMDCSVYSIVVVCFLSLFQKLGW